MDKLTSALNQAQTLLQEKPLNPDLLSPAFGTEINLTLAQTILEQWQQSDFSNLPEIEIISNDILGNAKGAYSKPTNKIYVSDYLLQNASSHTIEGVILEEIGHWFDDQINVVDSAGDEGAIFSALMQGETLTEENLTLMKAEDDSKTININGQSIEVEMSAWNLIQWIYSDSSPFDIKLWSYNGFSLDLNKETVVLIHGWRGPLVASGGFSEMVT